MLPAPLVAFVGILCSTLPLLPNPWLCSLSLTQMSGFIDFFSDLCTFLSEFSPNTVRHAVIFLVQFQIRLSHVDSLGPTHEIATARLIILDAPEFLTDSCPSGSVIPVSHLCILHEHALILLSTFSSFPSIRVFLVVAPASGGQIWVQLQHQCFSSPPG